MSEWVTDWRGRFARCVLLVPLPPTTEAWWPFWKRVSDCGVDGSFQRQVGGTGRTFFIAQMNWKWNGFFFIFKILKRVPYTSTVYPHSLFQRLFLCTKLHSRTLLYNIPPLENIFNSHSSAFVWRSGYSEVLTSIVSRALVQTHFRFAFSSTLAAKF